MTRLTILIFLILLIISFVQSELNLKNLFIVHRHGDRTPAKIYPNDRYANESNFPMGFGELTNQGKQRMYNVGLYLRKRYETFLSENIREVYVRSSGKERCLESTELLINGAYPPAGIWRWNETINFQPVPVQTVNYSNDSMLNMFSSCPSAFSEFDKVFKSEFGQKIEREYKDLFSKLTEYTGQQVNDFLAADYIYDVLKEERLTIENFENPKWATDEILERLQSIHLYKFKLFSQTRRLQKLRLGVFLNEFTNKLRDALKKPEKKLHLEDSDEAGVRKVNVYSTHDIFLYNLIDALEISNPTLPEFGATLIFEFHLNEKSLSYNLEETGFVKIIYLNETISNNFENFNVTILKMKDSKEELIPLNKFLASFSELLITGEEWNHECLQSQPSDDNVIEISEPCSSGGFITTIVFETIIILILVFYIVQKVIRRR